MCFSPKVKIPKQDPAKIAAPAPAPLLPQVEGVQFGGSGSSDDEDKDAKDTSSEVGSKTSKKSGKSSLRVELSDNRASKSTGGGAKKTSMKSRMGK